jgi:acyl carrier protein
MCSDVEAAVRDTLAQVIPDVVAGEFELDRDLAADYGLTSLNKVLFMTSACEATGVPLVRLTEGDLAAMRTLRDVITGLAPHIGQEL